MNDPAPIRRTATYQDVLDASPNMVAELVEGALHLHPRPAARHARASFKIAARLDDPFENGIGGPAGWYFTLLPDLRLGEDVVVPDVAGWRPDVGLPRRPRHGLVCPSAPSRVCVGLQRPQGQPAPARVAPQGAQALTTASALGGSYDYGFGFGHTPHFRNPR